MKVLALCLVLMISLVTAGFFTPSPEKHKSEDHGDVRVKEGHAEGSVVIEFEKDDGNTKVSISPHDEDELPQNSVDENGYVATAKEKLSEEKEMEAAKQKIKEAFSSVFPEVKDTAQMASGKAHKMKESVKDAASEVSSKAKDKVAEKASEMKQGVKEQLHEKTEGAKEKAKEAEELMESASDRAKHKADLVKKEGKKGLRGIIRSMYMMVSPTRMRMGSFAGVLHLLGFAVAYGMGVWVSFASKYVLAGALPRQQFAMVQSKIYPVYFKAMASSIGMALLGHLMMGRKKLFSPLSMGMLQGVNLMISLVMVLVNLLYLEPRTTKVMFERMKKEKEEGRGKEGHLDEPSESETGATTTSEGATQEKRPVMGSSEILLRRLTSYSSLLNVATLIPLTLHLVHLGQHLHTAC